MPPPRRRRTSMDLSRPRPKFLIERESSAADTDSESEQQLRRPQRRIESPPSSFTFPFQAYAGNPDPGLPIPGRRRSSLESIKPIAPFMPSSSLPRSPSSNSLYKQSAAANMPAEIPRNSSVHSFRAPFLAPTSRPSSSLWSPPSYPTNLILGSSPSASSTALVLKSKPPLPSTRLSAPLQQTDKPWLTKPEPNARSSYLLTLFCIFLGFIAAAALAFFGLRSVPLLDENHLCMVLDESFSGNSLDESVWNYDIQLGGFGNGEFQMTTKDHDNIFLSNGNLYIHPTLTSDKVQNVMDGGNYTLDDCTVSQTNASACSASSSAALGSVINPIMSARINTKAKKSIRFGKVQVRAKLPQGDWLWPAIWLLPENDTYGAWPASGEIDILEARGNSPAYPSQGTNFVRSTVHYGPFPSLKHTFYGWWSTKRESNGFAGGFHTYSLEWDESFLRFFVDSRLHAMLEMTNIGKGKRKTLWDKAQFPLVAFNSTSGGDGAQVIVQNPYQDSKAIAPFDQKFYLILNLAVGGTSGWFPDGKGDKPWFDGSLTAMRDFAKAKDKWYPTWGDRDERSFRIDYVKMWEKC